MSDLIQGGQLDPAKQQQEAEKQRKQEERKRKQQEKKKHKPDPKSFEAFKAKNEQELTAGDPALSLGQVEALYQGQQLLDQLKPADLKKLGDVGKMREACKKLADECEHAKKNLEEINSRLIDYGIENGLLYRPGVGKGLQPADPDNNPKAAAIYKSLLSLRETYFQLGRKDYKVSQAIDKIEREEEQKQREQLEKQSPGHLKQLEKRRTALKALDSTRAKIEQASGNDATEYARILDEGGIFSGGTTHFAGMHPEAARSIALAFCDACKTGPILAGQTPAPGFKDFGKGEKDTYAWTFMDSGKIEFNQRYYSPETYEQFKQSYSGDVASKWHPAGTTHESLATHEIGHALDYQLSATLYGTDSNKRVSTVLRNKVLKELKIKSKDKAAITEALSEYAGKNPKEFFAEAYCEWRCSPNPRPLARLFGKYLAELTQQAREKLKLNEDWR